MVKTNLASPESSMPGAKVSAIYSGRSLDTAVGNKEHSFVTNGKGDDAMIVVLPFAFKLI